MIETEPETPEKRAYFVAHEAMYWLRNQLSGSRLEQVEPDRCRFQKNGRSGDIRIQDNRIYLATETARPRPKTRALVFDPALVDAVELGPQGEARFAYQEGRLRVTVVAGDNSMGELGTCRVELDLMLPLLESG